jgi:hypothetical protein
MPPSVPPDLTPAERARAVARVLAAGLLRLAEAPPETPAGITVTISTAMSVN